MTQASDRNVLISGAGIAGLTLAILLKERGWEPTVVERERSIGAGGYMMDFFGTGWDVARRMGLTEELRAIHYPIERMEFVDRKGRATVRVPIERVRQAFGGEYLYLRRSDLERILFQRARTAGVEIRFGASAAALSDKGRHVDVGLGSGGTRRFALVFGADGIHSQIRSLAFGEEETFAYFLGGYVAAFHMPKSGVNLDGAFRLHEETDRIVGLYPLGGGAVDATIVFRHPDVGNIAPKDRLPLLIEKLSGSGWIEKEVVAEIRASTPVYFDSLRQIRMAPWHGGRVALLGDACGCLTLLAGQGSQMAMAGAFVLATELQRHGDHTDAFRAYEALVSTAVIARQIEAERFAGIAIPSTRSRFWLRRIAMKLIFSGIGMRLGAGFFNAKSVLEGYS